MSLLCAGAVHRRLCRLHVHARPALSSPQPSGSSENARQWHFIRAERSSNGSCRSHRALEGSSLPSCFDPFVFLPRLATPALRLGDSGSLRRSVFFFFYDVTDAGPASHRVRLWQGGPASTYCRLRLLVLLFTGTGRPEVRKRPWPPRRPRRDGNGGRFVRSPCLPSWRGLRLCAVHQMLSLGPCAAWSIELPAPTVGECRRRCSLRRHKGGPWTVLLTSCHHVLLQGGFECVVAKCATGLRWLWWPRVRAGWRFEATLRAGSPWWSSGGTTRNGRVPPAGRPTL